jgi:glycylpeptide N-tetradecanoyltransferase
MDNHKFWKDQPIAVGTSSENKPIEIKKIDDINKLPYSLPDGYNWYTFNLNDDKDLDELYNFLFNYYVNNPEATKKFHYSKKLLKWFLCNNKYNDLIIGVKYKNKLLATICGIPMTIRLFDKELEMIEINFLCIHNKLRNKRLSPVLIKEATRRTNLHNIWQAFYTTNIDLPNCLFYGTYYHRFINVPKLIDTQFIAKPDKISINGLSKIFKTIDNFTLNLRKLEEKDCINCCSKFNTFHSKFKIAPVFTVDEFKSHFIADKVIYSYVVEKDGDITDFISFFDLSYQIKENTKYDNLKVAYGYYYFYFENTLEKLVENSILILKNEQFDLLNYLDQYDTNPIFDKLNFNKGEGKMNFNFFNWICPPVKNNEVALIMI